MAAGKSLSAYVNARVRGMKSSLLSSSELSTFLNDGNLKAVGEKLLTSPYEVELAESLSRYDGAEALEDAVTRNLVHDFAKLKAMCLDDMASLANIFIGRWDLIGVKALLRNRHHGLDAETGSASLVACPSMPVAVQNELAAQDSMEALIRGLVAWNTGLCRGLTEALPKYNEANSLRVLEDALDRSYFVGNLARLGRYKSDDAKFIQSLLRAEIDRINLRRIFEPRPAGVEAEDVMSELLPRGRLSDQLLRDIATSASPDRAAEVLANTPYGDMAEALSAFSQTGKFSALERQFELKFIERLRRAVQRQGIGLASLLRYAWLKYNEVTNLRIIAHGISAQLPKPLIEQEVLYV